MASSPRREWLALQGHIQPLHSYSGLNRLREDKSDRNWFVIQDSNLHFYEHKRNKTPPDSQPLGNIDIAASVLEVFVVISRDGRDYQLSPPKDVCVFDWVTDLKEAVKLANTRHMTASPLERGVAGGSIMGKLRNSFRRKKKVTRALSENSTVGSHVNGPSTGSPRTHLLLQPMQKQEPEVKRPRSKSFPAWEEPGSEGSSQSTLSYEETPKEPSVEAEDCVLDSASTDSYEKRLIETPTNKDLIIKDEEEEEAKKETVKTESVEVQTDPITDEELLSLQQQKITKELEIEVCKLKCEVISLIQASIKIPLKDDDLADWQLIEDIRYKDRIYKLLSEARLYNPSLPDFDGSASFIFKDSYGFIIGSRESESELFHFLCRELKQHYSSFFQNRDGHARLWSEYIKSKQQDSKNVFFKEAKMKALLREGIPRPCRREVWKSAMMQKVEHFRREKGRDYYQKLLLQVERRKSLAENPLNVTDNQIKCDLLRTMPNNERFRSPESDGVKKLSRILRAFCVHRPDINYLQGMNFIVAMCLLFMDEEDAFWSLVAVSEVYLKDYFDRSLSGALADQSVLNDLVRELLPVLHEHLKYYAVDITTVTFNWFVTIFIDAVPFETALRIWDCFVFEGREALFRIAVGLLKVQQPALLQLSCPLDIMQYMKRATRVTYDKDQLIKSSYDELKAFPTTAMLDEKQANHMMNFKSRRDEKTYTLDELMRSRVSSFTVEIPNQEKLDKPDQHEILECALATSQDLSSPVCLFCGSRYTTKVYQLDINKKEMRTLDVDLKSRVLCADILDDGTILVGTVSWYIHAFLLELSAEVWCVQLNESVVDIAHMPEGKVFAALADGSVAVLQNASRQEAPSEGSHVRVGGAPVTCITLVNENVWCGCANNVVILDGNFLVELGSLVVSDSRRHQVSKLTHGKHGVWCTVRGSSCVLLLDQVTFDILLKVDNVASLDTSSDTGVIAFKESRVTTVMAVGDELWVGLGNGHVVIFDVIKNNTYEDEAYVVLNENEDKKQDESSTQLETVSAVLSKSTSCTDEISSQPEGTTASENEDKTSEETSATGTEQDHNVTTESSENYELSSTSVSSREVSTENSTNAMNKKHPEKQTGKENLYHSDYRFSLRLRVHYRINEEAIRCLLLVREEDPLVLSCGGSFSEEGALSLWQRQREEETDEWLPFSIKHRFTETPGPIPRWENTPVYV
ncbi:hypothetical protein ABFA07_001163 [Porites harrisoni]